MSPKVKLMLILILMVVLTILLGICIMVKLRKRTNTGTGTESQEAEKEKRKTSGRKVTFSSLVSTVHFDPAAPPAVRFEAIAEPFESQRRSILCICGCNDSSTEDGKSHGLASPEDKGETRPSNTKTEKK